MSSPIAKLDQALKDLIEAFVELEEELDDKFGDDEEKYSIAVVESLEGAIENAIEDQDSSTNAFATIVSALSEALESLDPSAFDDEDGDDGDYTYSMNDVDIDLDDDDDDIDLDDEDIDD